MAFKRKKSASGSTIPYHLRHHKAIERNLFLIILKKLDRFSAIEIENYRYVGFGAAFLEDFKALHSDFGILNMDCIEIDKFAFTRQAFNNPFEFINLHPIDSTRYITEGSFKEDLNQIIWWDFAIPKQLRQQLNDIELTAQKLTHLDILKITHNAELSSFISSHKNSDNSISNGHNVTNFGNILDFFHNDPTFSKYIPESINRKHLEDDFPSVIRAMAIRAIKRGLAKNEVPLEYVHIASFTYADGQMMTTLTGIICNPSESMNILAESGISTWQFHSEIAEDETVQSFHIEVPVMTVLERSEIDKKISVVGNGIISDQLPFFYGADNDEHKSLIENYCRFYRYLPYYSKVIY